MHISEKFKLNITGHKDIEFIDVDETNDTKLYLDPYVIQALHDDFCLEAQKCIDSFFTEVFNACKCNDFKRLQELLKYASEPNETNLGMKRVSKYGKGSTSDHLIRLFMDFYKIVRDNPNFDNNPMALCMYMKNFDKDHMSDLITNVLRKSLYIFTMNQCYKWNISISDNKSFLGYYWNYKSAQWNELHGAALVLNRNQSILLVPKHIVRQRYVYNVDCYIRQYILKALQKWHLDNNTDLCTRREDKNGRVRIAPPIIDGLYNREVVGMSPKDYARIYSKENILDEQKYMEDIFTRIRKGYGQLSDEQLDKIVYSDLFRHHYA